MRRAAAPLAPLIQLPDFLLARTTDDVIEMLRVCARRIACADGATVVARIGDEVEYIGEDAIAPLWTGQRFAIHACVTGFAMIHAAPVVIPDIRSDPRVPLHLYLSTFVASMAVFPIGRTDPTHAIGIYWQTKGPADPAALARIAVLAQAAGDAIARIGRPDAERAA